MTAFRNKSTFLKGKIPVATNKPDIAMRQREEAFMSRYDALFRWAYSLTNDHAEADALMQDCYALFVTANTNALIEDLDAYLRRMLSNIRQSNLMRPPNAQANQNKPGRLKPLLLSKSYADTGLWDLVWLPVRLISKLILPAWRQRKTQ